MFDLLRCALKISAVEYMELCGMCGIVERVIVERIYSR